MTVLLLGGSGEAVALAHWLAERDDVRLIASLKGVTAEPTVLGGELVVGGFGGAARLERFLDERDVAMVVDATHPYARRIARNARRAALVRRIPHLKLWRPAWIAEPGDRWHDAADVADAYGLALGLGRRPFVSLGAGGIGRFPTTGFLQATFRAVARPPGLDRAIVVVEGRGPFTVEGELTLLRSLGTDVVVTKNAGGTATKAKLVAARLLGLPVVMIRRPPDPPPPWVDSVAAAQAWLDQTLARAGAVGPGFPPHDTAKPRRR